MRFVINVPDSTRPELQAMLVDLASRLSERPELVEEIGIRSEDDAGIQRMFTPERLAHIAKAKADIEAGRGLTLEQVEAQLAANKAEWHSANPS